MTPRERYAVFLKALGIWTVVAGLAVLPTMVRALHGYRDSQEFFYMIMGSVASPGIMVLAGYLLLFSTDWFVRATFRGIAPMDDEAIKALAAASPSEVLLSMLLKLIGLWNLINAAAEAPGLGAYIHQQRFQDTYLSVVLHSSAAVLALSGFVLVFSTGWFVRMAGYGSTSNAELSRVSNAPELSAQELFAVIIRAVAVWLCSNALMQLPNLLAQLRVYLHDNAPYSFGTTVSLSAFAIPIAIGIWLFFGTSWFVRLAFSERTASDQVDESAPR